MAKRTKIELPYPTFGNHVYLGYSNSAIRKRARKAGLKIVTRRQFRKIILANQVVMRLVKEGCWFDTVKY